VLARATAHLPIRFLAVTPLPAPIQLHVALFPLPLLWQLDRAVGLGAGKSRPGAGLPGGAR
jgi:hypothetical protein